MLSDADIVFSRCDLFSVRYSVDFQSIFICSLLLDLNPYCENNPDVRFPLFCRQVARKLAPKSVVISKHQIKLDSFSAY